MKKNAIEIFARIWFIWFLFASFFIIIVCYPFIIFTPQKHTSKNAKYISCILRICAIFFCTLGAFRIHLVGKENYKKNDIYIFVANHRSLIDIPMLMILFHIRIIAKNSFFTKVPFFATYYKRGTVLVDRKSLNSRSQSFEEMKHVLAQNISMAIYPEGTRNRTQQSILPFHNGAFKLAKETGVHILPIVLFNTDKAIPITKRFFAMPTQINIHILPPMNPDDFHTMEAMRNEVQKCIKMEYEKYESTLKSKTLFSTES